jgi:type IV pilus assembly protein PilE
MMREEGFTLLELLLSVVIIGLLTAMSLPVYETFARRNDLDLTTQTIAAAMRRAETYARGENYDSNWGIKFQSNSATLYRGTAYATRTAGFDEIISIPGSITASGLDDIQFAKMTGIPVTTGSLTLSSTTNDTRTITLNAKGMVNY